MNENEALHNARNSENSSLEWILSNFKEQQDP